MSKELTPTNPETSAGDAPATPPELDASDAGTEVAPAEELSPVRAMYQ